jgi:hypothetical protein
LIEDWDRSQGTVLYHPGSEGMGHGGVIGNGYPGGGVQGGVLGGPGGSPYGNRRISGGGAPGSYQQGGGRRQSGGNGEFQQVNGGNPQARRNSGGQAAEADPNFREQKISIPSDMVYVFSWLFSRFERRTRLTPVTLFAITIASAPSLANSTNPQRMHHRPRRHQDQRDPPSFGLQDLHRQDRSRRDWRAHVRHLWTA